MISQFSDIFSIFTLFPFMDTIPVFSGTILVLEILEILTLGTFFERLWDLFRYYCLDAVPDPPDSIPQLKKF